jgi:hypothetical protein
MRPVERLACPAQTVLAGTSPEPTSTHLTPGPLTWAVNLTQEALDWV